MTEKTFVRELERRADHVHGAPLSFDDVRGTAHSIRRRRRGAVAGAVAAAVVLIAVVPSLLSTDTTRSDDRIDPAPSPQGQASVMHDGQIRLPDGGTVQVGETNDAAQDWAPLPDGRVVVVRNDPGSVQVYSPEDPMVEYPIGDTYLTASSNGDVVTWMERDGGVQVLESGVAEPVELGTVEVDPMLGAMISAVLDAEHVLVSDGNTTTTEVTADGVRPLTTSEPLRVSDVSPDGSLWAVQYADDSDPQFGCAGLYDPAAGEMVARNCDTAALRFSPDGSHLTGALGDGGTWGSVEVFDDELQQVLSYEPAKGEVVKEWGWADDGHLLVTIAELDGATPPWWLMRVPIDGAEPEILEGPVTGENPELTSQFKIVD